MARTEWNAPSLVVSWHTLASSPETRMVSSEGEKQTWPRVRVDGLSAKGIGVRLRSVRWAREGGIKVHHAAAPSQISFPARPIHSSTGIPAQRHAVRRIRTSREMRLHTHVTSHGKDIMSGRMHAAEWGDFGWRSCRALDENDRGEREHEMRLRMQS